MMRFLKWLPVILLGMLLILMFSLFERYPHARWVGPSGMAATDAYHAVGLWLNRLGAQPHRMLTLSELSQLPPQATLLLGDRRDKIISPQHVDQLLDWVKRGGRLLVEAEQPGETDLLLEALQIKHEADNEAHEAADVSQFALDGRAFRVQFMPYQNLEASIQQAEWHVKDRFGLRVVHLRMGKGRITVMSNFDFMVDNALARHDHADFLWYVLNQGGPPSPVWVGAIIEGESTWQLLARTALPALITTAILLLAWLWHIAPRFGPLQPEPQPIRRRLSEHLAAVGRFWWQHGLQANMLNLVRQWVMQRIQRHPTLAPLPTDQLTTQLAERTRLTTLDIDHALHGQPKRSEAFLRCMQALIRIHQSL
ncbi:hypothetical protein HNQ59_000203 [Chitinivorax tropicus]|uniref:DUF4350 domain-containing protein n=1 Tax=Chitinivorax tropicus TaxID=714531 RepID=A0A840MNW9_9PROT|nr:DUF4350 domain-containing protein [Chitinivorax tropicus]MBB5016941.1 hypothetical protein [Chitinivorax tropicus]